MMSIINIDNEKVLSKSIDLLRIPLACLIVLGHSNPIRFIPIVKGNPYLFDYTVIQYPITLFSYILFSVAVPLFFFISGFLFFYYTEGFNMDIYKCKIEKRISTLLIPYIVWNIFFGVPSVIKNVLSGNFKGILDLLIGIWVEPGQIPNITLGTMTTPIDSPLWFLRDLFVTMLLAPVIYRIVKRKRIFVCVIAMLLFWFILGLKYQYLFPGLSIPALLFFSIGAYVGINKINFIEVLNRPNLSIYICILWFTFALIDLFTSYYYNVGNSLRFIDGITIVHNVMIFLGIGAYFIVASKFAISLCHEPHSLEIKGSSKYFLTKMRNKIFNNMGGASFVIFAVHMPFISKLYNFFIPPLSFINSDSAIVMLSYVFVFITCFIISIITYLVVSRYSITRKLFVGNR